MMLLCYGMLCLGMLWYVSIIGYVMVCWYGMMLVSQGIVGYDVSIVGYGMVYQYGMVCQYGMMLVYLGLDHYIGQYHLSRNQKGIEVGYANT